VEEDENWRFAKYLCSVRQRHMPSCTIRVTLTSPVTLQAIEVSRAKRHDGSVGDDQVSTSSSRPGAQVKDRRRALTST